MSDSEYEFQEYRGNLFRKKNDIEPSMPRKRLEWEPTGPITKNHLKEVDYFLNLLLFETTNSSNGFQIKVITHN